MGVLALGPALGHEFLALGQKAPGPPNTPELTNIPSIMILRPLYFKGMFLRLRYIGSS